MLNAVRALVCKDTLTLAKWLFELAVQGKIRGLAVAIRLCDGGDEIVLAGAYRKEPTNAVTAAGRMYWAASRAMELQREQGR